MASLNRKSIKIYRAMKHMGEQYSTNCRRILDALFRERPHFHGWERVPGSRNYSLSDNVLTWMTDHIPPGGAGLETGCGYSTLVFAAMCSTHTAVSPFPHEHRLIRDWGSEHALDMENVTWIAGLSQEHLPGLKNDPPLDTVLIDGDHAFPAPFMDWYWSADRLKVGGIMIVDDIQLATGRILKEFLEMEQNRWELMDVLGRTAVFKRISTDPVARGLVWTKQPWVGTPPDYRENHRSDGETEK